MQVRPGGSFAPPLTEEKLASYATLISAAKDDEVRDKAKELLDCCKAWWDLPESGPDGSHPHPSGRGTIVPLDEPIAKALYDVIPWKRDLDAMSELFDGISNDTDKPLRDAVHHLLWTVRELDLDREPVTSDLL